MDQTSYLTAGGVRVLRTAEAFDEGELDEITRQVQLRPGGVLSSGMEYPGRYSRWHLAYIDPPVQIVARGRLISATALNERGEVLLPVIAAALYRAAGLTAEPARRPRTRATSRWSIPDSDEIFTEEQRSRRPTVFSALREIIARSPGRTRTSGCTGRSATTWRSSSSRCASSTAGTGPSATWCCTCPT